MMVTCYQLLRGASQPGKLMLPKVSGLDPERDLSLCLQEGGELIKVADPQQPRFLGAGIPADPHSFPQVFIMWRTEVGYPCLVYNRQLELWKSDAPPSGRL